MTSMFDYDDSVNLAYNAKTAGKSLVAAKHELFNKTGEFLFLAHSDREFAMRCQMVEKDIEKIAHHKLASLSDSKAKLVRAAFDEWQLRHANCNMCKTASPAAWCGQCGNGNIDELVTTAPDYKNNGGVRKLNNNEAYCADRKACDLRQHEQKMWKNQKDTGSWINPDHIRNSQEPDNTYKNPNRDFHNLHNYPINYRNQ